MYTTGFSNKRRVIWKGGLIKISVFNGSGRAGIFALGERKERRGEEALEARRSGRQNFHGEKAISIYLIPLCVWQPLFPPLSSHCSRTNQNRWEAVWGKTRRNKCSSVNRGEQDDLTRTSVLPFFAFDRVKLINLNPLL